VAAFPPVALPPVLPVMPPVFVVVSPSLLLLLQPIKMMPAVAQEPRKVIVDRIASAICLSSSTREL